MSVGSDRSVCSVLNEVIFSVSWTNEMFLWHLASRPKYSNEKFLKILIFESTNCSDLKKKRKERKIGWELRMGMQAIIRIPIKRYVAYIRPYSAHYVRVSVYHSQFTYMSDENESRALARCQYTCWQYMWCSHNENPFEYKYGRWTKTSFIEHVVKPLYFRYGLHWYEYRARA